MSLAVSNDVLARSTGLNMTAVSVRDKVYVSSKVGLADIDRSTFEKDMAISG